MKGDPTHSRTYTLTEEFKIDMSNLKSEYREIFEKRRSSQESQEVIANFDAKLEETLKRGEGDVAETAQKVFAYFNDPSNTDEMKAMAATALLYFIVPVDIIPDLTPFFGFTDDAMVMVYALRQLTTAAGMLKSGRKHVRGHLGLE